MHRKIRILFVALLFLAGSVTTATAQVIMDSVAELAGIDVVDHLGDTLPLDLQFVDETGDSVQISKYFGQGKPIILMLGYYECPMLCNLVFNGLTDAVKQLGWTPGEKYQIITVSIDPTEKSGLAAAKKANYIKSLELPGSEHGWAFLTGTQEQIDKLTAAIGFQYYYVKERDEYAHPAVITLISDNGRLSRYLFGISYPSKDLKLAILEASEGKVGSVIDKIILYCYHYDPDAGSYTVFAQNVMKLGGFATVVVLGAFVSVLWRRDRKRVGSSRGRANGQATHNADTR